MYKCPYCGQDSYAKSSRILGKYTCWKSIRAHISNCKLNTRKYLICEIYGPISFQEIDSYKTIEHLKLNYPGITGISKGRFKVLRKENKISLRPRLWNKESIIEAIQNWVKINNKIPEYRDWDNNSIGIYPSTASIKKYFGSWNTAIEAAGFKPNENDGFGIRSKALDGILYRSLLEVHFVNQFLFEKHKYEYERKYDNHNCYYDFYLPDLDLYIELAGGLRPEVIQEKIEINRLEGKNFLVLYPKDVYSNKTLEELIKEIK